MFLKNIVLQINLMHGKRFPKHYRLAKETVTEQLTLSLVLSDLIFYVEPSDNVGSLLQWPAESETVI